MFVELLDMGLPSWDAARKGLPLGRKDALPTPAAGAKSDGWSKWGRWVKKKLFG